MKAIARILIVLVLMTAVLPVRTAAAASLPADPTCAEVAAQLGATSESVSLNGSIICIMYPPRWKWNRDVVVFAHGYVDARKPVGIPWDQLIREDTNLPAILIKLGYGFATTSYRTNGLAIKDGVTDILELVDYIRAANSRVKRVFLTGASEGGLVTALALEKYPQYFAGALSTCGPVGSFLSQVQYWYDFRVAFDVYFPNVLADPFDPINQVVPFGRSSPIYIDPMVEANWEAIASGFVTPWLALNPVGVEMLLAERQVPIDPADPVITAGKSILELLYYNVEATNNGRMVLNPAVTPDLMLPPSTLGSPYENLAYINDWYPQGLQRDPAALAEISAFYETSGVLKRQMVLMHTTGDPVIPFQQSLGYLQKAVKAGSLTKVAYLPVQRYGHCNFTAPELVLGFYMMVFRSTLIPFSDAQIREALPEIQQQRDFKQLKEANKDKEKTK